MAAKAYLEQSKKPGTLVFFGCPAEEQGFGKGFMAKARCFDGVDMMFTWHPADQNVPMGTRMVANYEAALTSPAFPPMRAQPRKKAGAPWMPAS